MEDNKNNADMREITVTAAKEYKVCWIKLAQSLYSIHRDRLFERWGFERFEHYTEKELSIKKSLALSIVKTYQFTEDWEPQLLEKDFLDKCPAGEFPSYDAMNFLRKTRSNKHLKAEEYKDYRDMIIEKKQPLAEVRKELTALIRERKEEDSDEAREKRSRKSIVKVCASLQEFKKDSEALKLIPLDVIKKAEELSKEIQQYLD